ncbi:MAG TPA: response regulator [Anaerolineales bacterium]|nr:response regulator [Anaerolineales bacterium]
MAGKHILIVDDEPRVAFLLGRALERSHREKYRVTVVHSGEEVLEILERSSVDLLVTDLRMPGISGLDLIRQARAISPETRTILITAYGNSEVEAEARRLEAYRYITKPFDVADFTRAVEGALREVAAAHPGLLVLSDACFEAIAERLESLRQEVGAQCVFLADMQGQRLVEAGNTERLNVTALLALLAGGIAASTELAHQLGDEQAFNLNFHEGHHYDIYSATVAQGLFLIIVCDRQMQPSRIGLVWLYTRRTIEYLRSILSSTSVQSTDPPTLGEDFGASLAAELDILLSDNQGSEGPVPQEIPSNGTAITGEKRATSEESVSSSPCTGKEEPPGESELLDWETAVRRGLIPSDLLGSE